MENHSIVIPTKDKLFNLDPLLRRTPGNILTWIILTVGLIITIIRFTQGIGSVTNLDDNQPWGLWIGFDLLCGVCLAAGGYFTTVACYVMGMKHFHSAVRPAVTTAFLGYAFVVVALLYDLGHPLRLPYMFFFPGTTSVLFEVGLCVATYVTVLSFSRAASFILFAYFMLKLIDMLVQANLPYLFTGYGVWWLVEMLFFVLMPALLYAKGARDGNVSLCRFASANAIIGIVLNRFNVSMIAFNYNLPPAERYFPSIWEICISIFVVTMIVTSYRFIVYNMPVLYEHPDFKDAH